MKISHTSISMKFHLVYMTKKMWSIKLPAMKAGPKAFSMVVTKAVKLVVSWAELKE